MLISSTMCGADEANGPVAERRYHDAPCVAAEVGMSVTPIPPARAAARPVFARA
jgi:hypothetical protein